MKQRIFLKSALLIIAVNSCAFAQKDIKQSKVGNESSEFLNGDEAVARAIEYIGFDKMPDFSRKNIVSAELISIHDDKTPFLHGSINNRDIWHVIFTDIQFSFISHPEETDTLVRIFKVYIDPQNGALLKIESKLDVKDPDIAPESPPDRAEMQLKNAGESYHDFLKAPAELSFYEVLDKVPGTALSSKEISAILIDYSNKKLDKVLPVWAITYRGLPPLILGGPGDNIPIQERNYIRQVINATSGQLMYVTTIPTVEPIEGAQNENNNPNFIKKEIISRKEAINKALEYTGFKTMKGFSREQLDITAELVTINDDKTPFLHDKINGRNFWKIVIQGVRLQFEGHPTPKDTTKHNFNILIDPQTKQLLKIFTVYNGDNVDFLPEPSIEWAERESNGIRETFIDFADSTEEYLSLYEVLVNMCPVRFKEMSGHLIYIKRCDKDAKLSWSITFRGTPPGLPKGEGADKVPMYYLNYTRNVYDAKTGQVLYMTSIPTVEPIEGDIE